MKVPDRRNQRGWIGIQAELLMDNFAFLVKDCDDVGMGELAVRFFLEFHAEENREFESIIGFAAEEEPIGWQGAALTELVEALDGVVLCIHGDENEAGIGDPDFGEACFDLLHVMNDDGTGVAAGSEKHGDDLDTAAELGKGHGLAEIGGPGGFNLIDGAVGEGFGGLGNVVGGAAGRRGQSDGRNEGKLRKAQ